MRATAIIGMLGDEVLDFLSATTQADYKVHKLKGAVVFKLLVYSLLTHREASLWVLEGVFNSFQFKIAAGLSSYAYTRYNSLRNRIATLPSAYFKTLFEHSLALYKQVLPPDQQRLIRYDSTMVAVSAHLLHFGIRAGEKTQKRQVRFIIGFDGLLPCAAKAYTHKSYTSENRALSEAILEASYSESDIVVFVSQPCLLRVNFVRKQGRGAATKRRVPYHTQCLAKETRLGPRSDLNEAKNSIAIIICVNKYCFITVDLS